MEEILNNWLQEKPKDKFDKELHKYTYYDLMEFAKHYQTLQLQQTGVSCWGAFDWLKIETRPTEYGKYLICRKDGKIHWETWNGSGWAYNHNEIRFWAVIVPPCS